MNLAKSLSLAATMVVLFPFISLHARTGERTGVSSQTEEKGGPWFTGPLLAPSAHVVPVGFFNIEPYLFVTDNFGEYDKNWHAHSIPRILSVSPQLFMLIGIAKSVDFQILPQVIYNKSQGKSATHFGDLPMGFNFQLLSDRPDNYYPAIKLSIHEVFPTGKYQKLNPNKHGTDDAGGGSFVTSFGLVASRLFHLGGIYYLNARLSNFYRVRAPVHVKGFNNYGGGFGTKGKVHPGSSFDSIIGLEFTLAQHWAFATDIAYFYRNKSTFSGKHGRTATGAKAIVGDPSSNQFSLAPAIEYNFNESLGLIGGAWFTAAGRNSLQFASGVLALNWYSSWK